jgi:hypothetical protein
MRLYRGPATVPGSRRARLEAEVAARAKARVALPNGPGRPDPITDAERLLAQRASHERADVGAPVMDRGEAT